MRAAGLDGVRLLETAGHPAVFGQWLGAPGRPTVLFYGHYDVQPPDPLAEWTTPPFQPTLRDGRLYARGADDMKGNLLLPILACEAWLRETGEVPVNVKVLLEGEEEIGSPHFGDVLGAHRDLLACDHAICADGSQLAEDMPSVGVGTRGIVSAEITCAPPTPTFIPAGGRLATRSTSRQPPGDHDLGGRHSRWRVLRRGHPATRTAP